jgi:hypothetical protein
MYSLAPKSKQTLNFESSLKLQITASLITRLYSLCGGEGRPSCNKFMACMDPQICWHYCSDMPRKALIFTSPLDLSLGNACLYAHLPWHRACAYDKYL